MSSELLARLELRGLASQDRIFRRTLRFLSFDEEDGLVLYAERIEDFPDRPWSSEWVAMPEKLVVVYNSMLVEAVAAANELQPTTDVPDAFAVVNNWSTSQIVGVLLGRPGAPSPTPASELAQAVAFLAVNVVVPANLDEVPAERILQIRERYGAEFQAFGLAVDQAAADLAQLAGVRDPGVIERYLRDEVASRFIRPAENLRRQLSGLRLDAASMTVNAKTELPPPPGSSVAQRLQGILWSRELPQLPWDC